MKEEILESVGRGGSLFICDVGKCEFLGMYLGIFGGKEMNVLHFMATFIIE